MGELAGALIAAVVIARLVSFIIKKVNFPYNRPEIVGASSFLIMIRLSRIGHGDFGHNKLCLIK